LASVILVRHSRSTANTAGVLAGQAPGISLDETGFTQAQGLTTRIGDIAITRVISSPLQRCIETISPWHEKYGKSEIEIDNNFIESDYGTWTGCKLSELAKEPLWKEVQKTPSKVTFPEGESFQAMFKRVSTGLDSIIDKLAENDNVIVVSHGDIIKLAIAKILGLPIDNFQKLAIDPASISIVKVENSEDKEHSRRTALISMNESGTPLSKLLENKELAGLGGGKGDGGGA
jgi:probable phosphomutase (TIGR03848 family)